VPVVGRIVGGVAPARPRPGDGAGIICENRTMTMIAVTGAFGKAGRAVVTDLL